MPLANDVEEGTHHGNSMTTISSSIAFNFWQFLYEWRTAFLAGLYVTSSTLPGAPRSSPATWVYHFDVPAGRSFRSTADFSRMLYRAAFNDGKKGKECPLFTEHGLRGKPTLRIRILQHMTILHLQRKLAILAEDIVSSKTATEAQMDRVQETLQVYGTKVMDRGSPSHSSLSPADAWV